MKQLLLRVDDELHARLTAQARARGTSVNALANQVLSLAIDPTTLSRRDRLKLRLIAVGELGSNRPPRVADVPPALTAAEREMLREKALDSMRGVGPIADDLIDYQRGPR